MPEFLQSVLGPGSFIPHGHCYLWQTPLVWLHILSDGLIAASYYSIPVFLVALAYQRQDLPFRWLFWLFGGFIISCGTTHWMEVVTLWYPAYWVSGAIKAATALLSVWTVLELIPLFPQALAIPSTEQLRAINSQLAQEIEERKVVEKALQESQHRYVTLTEAVPVGICRFNQAGECIYVNDYWCQMTGRLAASAMGMSWAQTIHPEDQERIFKEWSDWLRSPEREPSFRSEARIQRPDGTIIWYYCQITVEVDPNGDQIGYVGSLTDISARKQIEQDLRQSEARLMEAQEVAHIGNWEYDLTTGKITWSDEIFRLFGSTPGQPEPNYASHLEQHYLLEDRKRLHQCIVRALEQKEPYELDLQIIRADGSMGWILARGKPILDANQQTVRLFGIAMDITEQKAAEAQQQQLNRMKDEFLSTVSHELRSPLANIKMAIRLLEISLAPMQSSTEPGRDAHSQRIQQYLSILREECDQELELVNNLLDLQRLEAASNPVELVPINVSEWVSEIASAYQERAQERQQHLQVLLPSVAPTLTSDVKILTSVLRELLTNACKYTPPGETITIGIDPTAERLQLTVSNSGTHISEEELVHIFDKFYRVSGGDLWKQGGTGLGLALARKQVEYVGGSIWAKSNALGVHFVVDLPLADQAERSITEEI